MRDETVPDQPICCSPVLPLDYVKRTAVHKQLSAAEKEHILDSPFTEVTKTEGMPNFSFTPALRSFARAQISLEIPEPFGAGALFLPSLIVPVMLPKMIDEHDVAVYIFL